MEGASMFVDVQFLMSLNEVEKKNKKAHNLSKLDMSKNLYSKKVY